MRTALLSCLSALAVVAADPGVAACNRIQTDARAGRPLVAHVVVALCDNAHQGIAPVPKALGNFATPLQQAGAHRLLLTTGFMAPEAYTLDAALKTWLAGKSPQAVHEAAAQAYHRYQRCGLTGARRLFRAEP